MSKLGTIEGVDVFFADDPDRPDFDKPCVIIEVSLRYLSVFGSRFDNWRAFRERIKAQVATAIVDEGNAP